MVVYFLILITYEIFEMGLRSFSSTWKWCNLYFPDQLSLAELILTKRRVHNFRKKKTWKNCKYLIPFQKLKKAKKSLKWWFWYAICLQVLWHTFHFKETNRIILMFLRKLGPCRSSFWYIGYALLRISTFRAITYQLLE